MPEGTLRYDATGFLGLLIVTTVFGFATACERSPASGPEAIHWDRQTCERCQMVISQRAYAAEIRLSGDRRAHAFDDLGCALLWLDDQGLLGEADPGAGDAEVSGGPEVAGVPELWVRDSKGSGWIDGRKARYAGGLPTPMAYGYGVAEEGDSLETIRGRIREAERLRRGGREGRETGRGHE